MLLARNFFLLLSQHNFVLNVSLANTCISAISLKLSIACRINKEQNILVLDFCLILIRFRPRRFCTVIKENRQTTVYFVWRCLITVHVNYISSFIDDYAWQMH